MSLVPAIADAIGLSVSHSSQPEQTLLDRLSDQRMLIVLDNFEQLIAEADLIEHILVAAPGVKLLISSRERLNIRHEWVIDLHGLPIQKTWRWQMVRQCSSLSNVHSRCGLIWVNWERDRCHPYLPMVDGMPLGLELAANWIRVMQATEIASQVERSIDFLATRQRDIPDRHRSIRAVFHSTWAQLPPQEQRVFSHLSIFRNGFTYDAATAVSGATPITLLSLIDKSLLTRDNNGRYADP